ncbi:peptidoglycan DD-metalloendopeptidase family protein [Erythrobacter jejuensis]|uniref:Peptidoglycan DD-metalloendopeptidase family protein n=2 Tax=Parerythrobacter jejuensis TaxID=795812 RepID=A0A845AN10_9SPHN|nr:M23 family metallopeptidase [Parerythrobacter jejuensis]MXP31004.1 peptidoglycan DD-metalloendopeptidase family protein [Parerythrobacter jejuensis]MXP33764.1 peptidoglycan DD-metalloendopeptidase family protein [Parerythrobacter jejuensis]
MALPWDRWAIGGAVMALAASCNPVALESSGAIAAETAQPAAAPTEASVPAGSTTILAQSVPEPTGPSNFEVEGELEQGGWIRGQAPAGAFRARLGGRALELDSEGRFFAAFDRDAGRSTQLIADLRDGSTVTADLAISPRSWNIERVNVARRSGGPSAAFWKRRKPELDQINAARSVNADSDGWRQDFVWPVKGRISGRFGSQRIYRGEPGSYHSGIDIATGASGTPFVAPADGVVTLATPRPFSLEGYLLIIDHGQGLNSAFLHMSKIAVGVGETVRRGQYIGNIGSSGRATGPHLHWSIKWRDTRLDPLLFTGPMN